MVEELSWEHRELAKSVYYGSMSVEFKEYAIEYSKQIGFAAAEQVQKNYGIIESREALTSVIQSYNATVYMDENKYGFNRLSDYDEKKGLITCYIKAIRQAEQKHPAAFQHIGLLSLCMAHELFHHLEAVKLGKVSNYVKVPYALFGLIKLKRGIEATREIAAHTFVMCLFRLTQSPADMVHF